MSSGKAAESDSVKSAGPGVEEMAERIRGFAWSTTPLGPTSRWPQSLRTVVNILLSSRYAMWMAWGPELTMFYNDAYRATLGIKHPWALAKPASEVWPEIWPDIGPRIEAVLGTGKATYDEGLLLFLQRSGFPEETYHTFSYSPLENDEGRISGMLCVVTEETDRLIGERRVATLRDVASALASKNTEEEILEALEANLGRNQKDLPFTLTYLFDDAGVAHLACSSGIAKDHPLAPERIERGSNFPWPALQMHLRPMSRFMDDLTEQRKVCPLPTGDWNKPVEQVALVPIKQQGQQGPAGFFAVGTNPYRRYDIAYRGFVDLLAGQIAAGLANARAYATERRRAEALAEIDRAKTTFFSNVSHELRTPLTLMLSPVEELLAEPDRQKPADRELLELVHRNSLRLQKLVNTLLDFSRIEAGRIQADYEPTQLGPFTADLASNFRSAMERAGLQFSIDCKPMPEPVYVDREMWEKIVLNLLSNALKFTLAGGVTVALRSVGHSAELTVQDTGTGIPESELPHIYERFHRVAGARGRTIEGTGIGLALVQELVKLHGGSISAASEVDKGTTFTVTIPFGTEHLPKEKVSVRSRPAGSASRADAFVNEAFRWLDGDGSDELDAYSVEELQSDDAGRRPQRGGERIILADDNADMREYVTRLLSKRYEVVAVSNGEEALTAVCLDPPDLILSDVMMPRLDGFSLLEQLRARPETRTIPVILLSARAGEESRVEGLGAGADDYLVKPFTARELVAKVAAHLAMRKRRAEAEQALRESQATLQSFYDSSTFLMGVIELDGDSIVAIYCNAATAKFFDTDVEDIPRQTGAQLGIPREIDAIWVRHYRESQEQGRAIRFEYEHPRPAGACWMSASVSFLGYGQSGRPRFSFIAEDVTERKRNEELLRHTNEEFRRVNSDLEQFAYSASHDLQEPLRQVAIFSQLLAENYAPRLDEKASQYLNYCIEGAHRMEMMIRDLLAYSQAGSSDSPIHWVSISEVVETAKTNLSATIEETQAEISTSALPVVRGEAAPLVHLFQNLLSNALKYRSERKLRVRIVASADCGYWRFAVEDNGIGIPADFQNQVFGIFKRLHDRTKYPGTGIGLAICQKIVERYGGRIWVESEPDRGSTFIFTLPRATSEPGDSPGENSSA